MKSTRAQAVKLGVESDVDWDAAATVLRQLRGLAVDVTRPRLGPYDN